MNSQLRNIARTITKAVCFSGALAMTCQAEPPRYRIADLGALDGRHSVGWSVNDAGQVVGQSSAENGEATHAFLYSEGVMQDLGTFARFRSTANDINESGQVAGTSQTSDSQRAFLYTDGVMLDLGQQTGVLRASAGEAINNRAEVTGHVATDRGHRAFIYSDGTMQTIELPPETGGCDEFRFVGYGINNSTQITGLVPREIPGKRCHDRAYLYSHGSGEMILIGDLLPDYGTVGYDINDSGQVVVFALKTGDSGAFLYSDGEMARIGGLGFTAWGLNNAGWVVGDTHSGGPEARAFLYVEGQVYDLNDLVADMSEWDYLKSAREISDSGYITGVGETASGASRAFLLTPIAVKVRIDIKPGGKKNRVNLRSKGNIGVAVLSTNRFDATQVNWETVRFGPKEATEIHQRSHLRDVDEDGDMDFVAHFKIRKTGIRCRDTKATLSGDTFDGLPFTGTGKIKVVKCR